MHTQQLQHLNKRMKIHNTENLPNITFIVILRSVITILRENWYALLWQLTQEWTANAGLYVNQNSLSGLTQPPWLVLGAEVKLHSGVFERWQFQSILVSKHRKKNRSVFVLSSVLKFNFHLLFRFYKLKFLFRFLFNFINPKSVVLKSVSVYVCVCDA